MEYAYNRYVERKYFIRDYRELNDKIIIKYANCKKNVIKNNKKNIDKIKDRLENQANAIIERKEKYLADKNSAKKSAIPAIVISAFSLSLVSISCYFNIEVSTFAISMCTTTLAFSSFDIKDYFSNKRKLKIATKLKFFKDNRNLLEENISYNNIEHYSLNDLKKIKEKLDENNKKELVDQIDKVKIV